MVRMEERFLQQLKKGVLELLVLQTICRGPTYGYELIAQRGSRSGGLFTLREGTLYPILYRLEDDGLIEAVWQQETGRAAPRKIYSATEKGREENERRLGLWAGFRTAVDHFCGRMQDMNEKQLARYLRAVRRRLSLSGQMKDRVMDDLRCSIMSGARPGRRMRRSLPRLARQSRPRQSLPRSCRATRSAKSPLRFVCLGAAVLALLAGLLKNRHESARLCVRRRYRRRGRANGNFHRRAADF